MKPRYRLTGGHVEGMEELCTVKEANRYDE